MLLSQLQMKQFWDEGTIHAKTRCWAQGMDGWRPLQSVSQLKWTLLASGQAVMNESDLATLILNMLIKMAAYYPSRWVLPDTCGLMCCHAKYTTNSWYVDSLYKSQYKN